MKTYKTSGYPIHYGWLIAFTGMLCIFACLGFGRFALGMLLPSMAPTLNLSYSQMGFISTANFIGYLVSVLLSGMLTRRISPRWLIFFALILVGLSMIFIGCVGGFMAMLVLYMLTGLGSGASNVPMMGLVSSWFSSRLRGKAAGFIVIGSGFAILLSGRLIPLINGRYGNEGWRLNWLVLGGSVVAIAFICLLIIRDRPDDVGLKPVGHDATLNTERPTGEFHWPHIYRRGAIYHLGAIYFLFGYTYVIYATFIVTALVEERGFSEAIAGNFWSWIGLLSLLSGPVFGTLSDRLGRKPGLIIVFSIQTLSYLLIATGLPGISLYLSIGFYGIVAWSIPSIMAAVVGDYVGPQRAAEAFGFITFIFGIGQIAGPAVAGTLAEISGSFSGGFYMAAIFAGTAIALTAFLKKPLVSYQ